MTYLQVFENEVIPIGGSHKKGLSEVCAVVLQQMENRLPADTLAWSLNRVAFRRCGVILAGENVIEIVPRLSHKVAASREIFINLLRTSGYFLSASPAYHPRGLQQLGLLDRYIFQFCEDLNFQIRRGMIRVYVNHQHKLTTVRGRLLFDQAHQSHSLQPNAVCDYDELSQDNIYNQVLKSVLKHLQKLTTASNIRRKVNELLNYFGAISDCAHDWREVAKLNFDRASRRYEPIFQHCQRVLQDLEIDPAREEVKSYHFLVDMELLFKQYVIAQIQRIQWAKGLQFKIGSPKKHLAQDLEGERKYVLLQPDVSILDSEKNIQALVHVKWNNLQDRNRKRVISQTDLAQLVSLATCYSVGKIFLVYPKPVDTDLQPGHTVVKVNGIGIEVVVSYIKLDPHRGLDWDSLAVLVQ